MKEEKLVYYVLKKCNLYHRKDDLLDVGYIGLAKGLKSFNSNKKTKKTTYLTKCIRNEILDQIKKEKAIKRNCELIPVHQNNLENIACDIDLEQMSLDKENNKKLYESIFKLPIIKQYILYRIFFKDDSIYNIAVKLEKTEKEVIILKNEALKEMRCYYE